MEKVIGLEPGIVRLLPYQEAWADLFAAEKARLQQAVGHYVLDIQHVGSTSIPGMPAKPIIDIGIAVKNFEKAVVCIAPIEALGYVYVGENGIPRRHYFRYGNPRAYQLHMNEISGMDWQNHILFRDYLCRNTDAARAYADLKMDLVRKFKKDRELYLNGKASFIEQILRLAQSENSK